MLQFSFPQPDVSELAVMHTGEQTQVWLGNKTSTYVSFKSFPSPHNWKKVRDIECLIFFALKENTEEKKLVKQEAD